MDANDREHVDDRSGPMAHTQYREVAGRGIFESLVHTHKSSFDFNGRARREELWIYVLGTQLVWIPLSLLIRLIPGDAISEGLTMIATVWFFLPLAAVTVRRMHDIGRKGAFAILCLVPILGLVLLLRDSRKGPNEYGPSPKYVDPRVALDSLQI